MPVYVVTGARTGIGLEYVRQLSHRPSSTTFALVRSLSGDLTSLRAIQSAATQKNSNNNATVHILECDISSPTSIAALPALLLPYLSKVRPSQDGYDSTPFQIDILLNNAATLTPPARAQTALTLTPETLHYHIATNALGPALLLQTLLPYLSPTARVANISSGIGSLGLVAAGRIEAALTAYSVSKAALNMLTVHQAHQLRVGGSKVLVVAMDPGHVKTESGGEGATVEVRDSAAGVLRVLEGVGEEGAGRFWLYNGEELPW